MAILLIELHCGEFYIMGLKVSVPVEGGHGSREESLRKLGIRRKLLPDASA